MNLNNRLKWAATNDQSELFDLILLENLDFLITNNDVINGLIFIINFEMHSEFFKPEVILRRHNCREKANSKYDKLSKYLKKLEGLTNN